MGRFWPETVVSPPYQKQPRVPYNLERFLTLRYLRGAQGQSEGKKFLRFIVRTAIGGVAVAVAALLLALAIVRGFSEEIEAKIVGFGAHVQVENLEDAPLQSADVLSSRIGTMNNVVSVTQVVQEYVLLRRSNREIDGVQITGVDQLPPYLEDQLVSGKSIFNNGRDEAGLVIGKSLADRLRINVGDRLTLFSVRAGLQTVDVSRPRIKQFVVSGIFETSLAHYDDVLVYADINATRELLDYDETQATRLDISVADLSTVDQLTDDIVDTLGYTILARSIFQVFRSLFAWVNLQEGIIPFVIGVIILVAAFNIVATLLMIILEKSSELGILAGMGASGRLIRRLFMTLGLAIGIVGTTIGSAIALVLELLQDRFELIPLPAESYYLSTAPVTINALDFLVVGALTIALCTLAAYIPARIGASIDPVKVIRFR